MRSSVVFSLMPFNGKGLKLIDQINDLRSTIEYVPHLKKRVEKISEIVNFLLENPMNPKRDTVLNILNDSSSEPDKIGLITNLTRGHVPGWTEDISEVSNFDDLPQAARNYIARLEELTGVPMCMISVGVKRTQNITRSNPFDAS